MSLLIAALMLLFQAGPGVLQPRRSAATQNYYVNASTGSDMNNCSSGSPCATISHTLTLVPQTCDKSYTINIAHGTYTEGEDFSGFVCSGSFYGGTGPILTLNGDTASPSSVVLTGTVQCDPSFKAGLCITTNWPLVIQGLTIQHGERNGVACYGGLVDYNNVVVTLTGGAAKASVGMNNLGCRWFTTGNLTVSGFDTSSAPTGGLGIYNAYGSIGEQAGGNIQITGPGSGTNFDGTVGMVLEYGSSAFIITNSSSSFTINGVATGLLVNDNGAFSSYVASAVTISNSTLPSGTSYGINTAGGGGVNFSTSSLTMNNWSTCIQATGNSIVTQGPGGRSLTNCTASAAVQGSQVVLF